MPVYTASRLLDFRESSFPLDWLAKIRNKHWALKEQWF
jgi:hypothetical protein